MLDQDAVIWFQAALSTLGTICSAATACGVAYIGYKQWKLASDRFRLDLFDKRYRIFEATRKFLVTIAQQGSFKQSDLFEFFAGSGDSEFLLGKDTTEYLREIGNRAIKMRALARQYEGLPVGDARTSLVEAEGAELRWLGDQLRSLSSRFPELKFGS